MFRAFAAAGALMLLAAGCGGDPSTADPYADTTVRHLAAEVAPYASCTKPSAVMVVGRRVDCHDGTVFIEAYPDAQTMQASLQRGPEGDLLVGDTWDAGADSADELQQVQRLLGGRIVHRKADGSVA